MFKLCFFDESRVVESVRGERQIVVTGSTRGTMAGDARIFRGRVEGGRAVRASSLERGRGRGERLRGVRLGVVFYLPFRSLARSFSCRDSALLNRLSHPTGCLLPSTQPFADIITALLGFPKNTPSA